MENRIAALEMNSAVLQSTVDALASGVSVLKADMSTLKVDVAVIKSNYLTREELQKGLAELGREIRVVQRWLVGLIIAVVLGFLYHGKIAQPPHLPVAAPASAAPAVAPPTPAVPAEPLPRR